MIVIGRSVSHTAKFDTQLAIWLSECVGNILFEQNILESNVGAACGHILHLQSVSTSYGDSVVVPLHLESWQYCTICSTFARTIIPLHFRAFHTRTLQGCCAFHPCTIQHTFQALLCDMPTFDASLATLEPQMAQPTQRLSM